MNHVKFATRMKPNILWTTLRCLLFISVVNTFFVACGDNDEPKTEMTYSWEFEEVSPSTSDFMDDKNKIESAFRTALGASDAAASVTRHGTAEQCDQEIREACQRAFDSLKDEAWQGRYVFTVTNTTTETIICTVTFDADDDNIILLDDYDEAIYTASDLKIGDYYYSDGTWSDGGLRKYAATLWSKLYYQRAEWEWEEPMPLPESGKTVIGIVFHVGHHIKDQSDYSKSGIGQEKCHGYVVALTNVNNDNDDNLAWVVDRGYEIRIGTSTNNLDWNGYSNQQKFHEFVNDESNKNEGWEMKDFPAAFACETYGNRTTDRDGNPITDGRYDWQKPFVAPNGTSGWFLPSCYQLTGLYHFRNLLSQHMDGVKNSIPDGVNYKSYIRGMGPDEYYTSSSEWDHFSGAAWGVYFYGDNSGSASTGTKRGNFEVRAILAF